MIQFQLLLTEHGLDPSEVLVLRHRPTEPELRQMLPSYAAEAPEMFDAYQRYQNPGVERQMLKSKFVAAFIGHRPGSAVFVGIFENRGNKRVTAQQRGACPEFRRLMELGCTDTDNDCLQFNLHQTSILAHLKGKLVIQWPGLERSWNRWGNSKSGYPIAAILEDSLLIEAMPHWRNLVVSWKALRELPRSWQESLRQWRGIYYIFDSSRKVGYVGSAYGKDNMLGRWLGYASSGHGGNKKLKSCDPEHFQFSVLELLGHDTPKDEVVERESSWKKRLHTREYGLNDN
jgi:hypothetical protein